MYLGLLPALVSENQLEGAPEAPVGRLMSAFLRKGKLPTVNMQLSICCQIKKNFFFLPLPKISLATVQWSNLAFCREGLNRFL